MMSIIAATWFSPPSPARRFISLYSPETPLNRYLEHIRGIYIAPGTPASAGHSTDLVTTPSCTPIVRPCHLSRLYLRIAHKKRSGVNAFKLVKKLAPASGGTDRRAPSPSSLPPPVLLCRCA